MNANNIRKVLGIVVLICGVLILVLSWTANKLDTRNLAEGAFMVFFGIFLTVRKLPNKKY